MYIDFSDLKKIGSYKNIKKELVLSDLFFREQRVEIPSPIQLNLDIYNTKDSFILTGELKGELILICSRCLDKFNQKINIKLEDKLLKGEIEELARVDLSDFIIENILLNIPIKPICSENCKGLCPQCGQNLNIATCNCKNEMIDPRLAKLKDFFKEED